LGGRHGGIDLGLSAARDQRPWLAGKGIMTLECTGGRLQPTADRVLEADQRHIDPQQVAKPKWARKRFLTATASRGGSERGRFSASIFSTNRRGPSAGRRSWSHSV